MTDRSRQGIRPPDPIPHTETERERLRILKTVAQRLPELAARRDIKMVGKGGTVLTLADGLTRPSTDYDADTDKPVGKPTLVGMMDQILKGTPRLREARAHWSGRRNDPVTFTWRNPVQDIASESFLNTTVRGAHAHRQPAEQLAGPHIDDTAVRIVDSMQVYTTTELMRGKASAFMGRARSRDTYDVAWALSTRLKDVEPKTRTTLDQFLSSGATDAHWKQWREDHENDPIMCRANMDDVMEIIIDCLEKDPVVRCAREPERGLAFWIDATANTVSLILPEQGDHKPREKLFEVPRDALQELALFVVDTGADLSHHLNLGPNDIRREGTGGLSRFIENGVTKFERALRRQITPR